MALSPGWMGICEQLLRQRVKSQMKHDRMNFIQDLHCLLTQKQFSGTE